MTSPEVSHLWNIPQLETAVGWDGATQVREITGLEER